MRKFQNPTALRILIVFALAVMLTPISACSKSGKKEAAPGAPGAKMSAADKEKLVAEVKKTYICPETNSSIEESYAEGKLCPVGEQVVELVGVMADAGWSADKIKTYLNVFVAGQDLSFFIPGDRQFLGKADAPVTFVEFTDIQCPYCKRFNEQAFVPIKTNYVDTGKVKYYQLNLPLPFHQFAKKAAEALYCAGDQGKYWEMRDSLFTNQQQLAVESIKGYAKALALDEAKFNQCLDSGAYASKVDQDSQIAGKAGVRGTPGFIVAKSRPDGKIRGAVVSGAQPFEAFKAAIDATLSK